MLGALMAPLRLPERVVDAVERAAEALEHVGPMREEVVQVRKQSEPLADILPAIKDLNENIANRLDSLQTLVKSLERVEAHLDSTVENLVGELSAMHRTVRALQDDVERVTDRLPDPDEPGPLGKARDALTPGRGD